MVTRLWAHRNNPNASIAGRLLLPIRDDNPSKAIVASSVAAAMVTFFSQNANQTLQPTMFTYVISRVVVLLQWFIDRYTTASMPNTLMSMVSKHQHPTAIPSW